MAEDPVRLFDESSSELLKSLLSAARDEQPNQAVLRRTLTAVGIGSAVTATASTASAASAGIGGAAAAPGAVGAASLGSAKGIASTTLLVVVKWLGAGAMAGILATSAIYAVSEPALPAPDAAPAAAVKVTAPAALARGRSGIVPTTPLLDEERAQPELPAAPVMASASAAPPVALSAPAPQPLSVSAEVDPKAPLAAELALLDSARQALAAGNAARALQSLNDYDVRFEHPNLAPEALYLRLEALTLQGDKSGTQAVARRLLRSYPTGPHAARARFVLGIDQ
jgi:hypothetical protein